MMNLNLLGNPSIEKIIATTLFDSLESLALCSCYDNLTGIRGIGPKKAKEIKEVLEKHGLRTKLSNEEYFLVDIFANDNRSELINKFDLRTKIPNEEYFLVDFAINNRPELINHFWENPMTDDQKNCLYSILCSSLFEKENAILKLHYGLGCERMSLEEIAQKYCSTRGYIKQILAKAKIKLRRPRIKRQLGLLMVSRLELQSRLLATEGGLSVAKIILEYYEQKYGRTAPIDGPIEVLNLSTRTYSCLRYAGINTIEEARNADLTKFRNFSRRSIEEMIEKISSL